MAAAEAAAAGEGELGTAENEEEKTTGRGELGRAEEEEEEEAIWPSFWFWWPRLRVLEFLLTELTMGAPMPCPMFWPREVKLLPLAGLDAAVDRAAPAVAAENAGPPWAAADPSLGEGRLLWLRDLRTLSWAACELRRCDKDAAAIAVA